MHLYSIMYSLAQSALVLKCTNKNISPRVGQKRQTGCPLELSSLFAKLNLNSTQFKSIEVEIALIPISPATHPPATHPKKYISQLLVAQFGPNFKERFLGPFLTDANRHTDIYPSNICFRNICPYKEYLSWYWPDFDQTLKEGSWDHLSQIQTVTVTFVHATFVLETLVHIRNISAVTDQILTRFFSPNFLQTLIFLDPKICGPTIFWTKFF